MDLNLLGTPSPMPRLPAK